jgi:phosphate transport system substrate-binding protein
VNELFKSVLSKTVVATLALSLALTSTSAFAASKLKGSLNIDGSSTVYPLTAAIAEEFTLENRNVKPTVSESGTGTGMTRFCKGEINIANASRAINEKEVAACKAKGVKYTAFNVALDGITVITNQKNTWAKELTTEQLKAIFQKGSTIKNWSDINKDWPAEKIKIYSPGAASGTYEFFTEHINKTKNVQRTEDVTLSEDDNVLVKGVSGDKYAIGYLGFGYYTENKSKLNAVNLLDSAKKQTKAVVPSRTTIISGSYTLARPLYVYVNNTKLKKGTLENEFMKFYIANAPILAKEVLMINLTSTQYKAEAKKLK